MTEPTKNVELARKLEKRILKNINMKIKISMYKNVKQNQWCPPPPILSIFVLFIDLSWLLLKETSGIFWWRNSQQPITCQNSNAVRPGKSTGRRIGARAKNPHLLYKCKQFPQQRQENTNVWWVKKKRCCVIYTIRYYLSSLFFHWRKWSQWFPTS